MSTFAEVSGALPVMHMRMHKHMHMHLRFALQNARECMGVPILAVTSP